MPARSKVELLPESVRAELERRLVAGGFSNYDALTAWLNGEGYEISRASVHRHAEKFEDRLGLLKISAEQAKAVVAASPDEEGAVTEALQRLVMERLFKVLIDIEVDAKSIDLSKLTRAIADMSRATVTQKRWAAEARTKARAELLAEQREELAKVVKQGGLSEEAAQTFRRQILGL